MIVQVGKIGDMILTTPLFSELKNVFPDCEICVLTGKLNDNIALLDKNVTRTIVYKKNLFSVLKLIYNLRKIKFDYWIDTKDEFSSTSKTLLKLGRYGKSLGFNIKENLFGISLKEYVKGKHTVDINLSPLFYFKKDYIVKNIRPSVNIPSDTVNKFSDFFRKIKNKKILVNISAGAENRYWLKEKWLELFGKIEKDFHIFLISDVTDKKMADNLVSDYKSNNLTYLSADNIFEVAEIVRNSDFIITPDTSIVHLASCFNKPIVAMFHNIDWVIKRYAPLSDKCRIILSKEKDSIFNISVDEVISKLDEIS